MFEENYYLLYLRLEAVIIGISFIHSFTSPTYQRFVFWHQEVASDSFCFLINSSSNTSLDFLIYYRRYWDSYLLSDSFHSPMSCYLIFIIWRHISSSKLLYLYHLPDSIGILSKGKLREKRLTEFHLLILFEEIYVLHLFYLYYYNSIYVWKILLFINLFLIIKRIISSYKISLPTEWISRSYISSWKTHTCPTFSYMKCFYMKYTCKIKT